MLRMTVVTHLSTVVRMAGRLAEGRLEGLGELQDAARVASALRPAENSGTEGKN